MYRHDGVCQEEMSTVSRNYVRAPDARTLYMRVKCFINCINQFLSCRVSRICQVYVCHHLCRSMHASYLFSVSLTLNIIHVLSDMDIKH